MRALLFLATFSALGVAAGLVTGRAQAQADQLGAPAPPPGYGVPPGAAPPASAPPAWAQPATAGAVERQRLVAEIAQLERDYAEHGLGGDITLLVGGGVAAIVSGYIWFLLRLADAGCAGGSCEENDEYQIVAGVFALGGVAVAAIGLINLIGTLGDRAPIRDALRAKKLELRELDRTHPWLQPVAGGATVGVRHLF